jgi:hypothetical protein
MRTIIDWFGRPGADAGDFWLGCIAIVLAVAFGCIAIATHVGTGAWLL